MAKCRGRRLTTCHITLLCLALICLISSVVVLIIFSGVPLLCRNLPVTSDPEPQCGYASCPVLKDGFVNVHLIPHSHDDVGWLKTVDQYFYGNRGKLHHAGVQYILDSVVQELKKDPEKRFIYVETAFFWKWWQRQSDEVRQTVKQLVACGQLEFIGGGWSMHDEATTHYQSVVDQLTWGFRRLSDLFGECGVPRVGWQIDPFGHSRESASIMARVGFDGMMVARVDQLDKEKRLDNKELEMIWETSPNLGSEADLFMGILYNHYSAPKGFCWDIRCMDDPIIDAKYSPDYNLDEKVESFLEEILERTKAYQGSNIAVVMGDDFQYQAAHIYYSNIDLLIKAVNNYQVSNNTKVHLFYSTPSCYLKALNSEGLQWPTKQDDFFPYSTNPHTFWTGYYTSRPTLKYYERLGNNFLQVCKQLSALSDMRNRTESEDLDVLREAMGVLQHHDAITGTETQEVAYDYARILSNGFDACGNITQSALNKLMAKTQSSDAVVLTSCLLLNISQCDVSETHDSFVVTLYNPLSRNVSRYVRLPVTEYNYAVYDHQGKSVEVQLVPIPESVTRVPGRVSEAIVELVFCATDLPPLGFRSFFISRSKFLVSRPVDVDVTGRNFTIGKSDLKLTIGEKGSPIILTGPGFSDGVDFKQNFYYYESAVGDNEIARNQSSGAYIFRPNSTHIPIGTKPSIKFFKGSLVEEVHQQFSEWASQVIRFYRDENHFEFNWMIGPIFEAKNNIGKEVVTQYLLKGMASNSTFYTDSNGREMIKRVRNKRPTYEAKLKEPISGNYYPVTTRIMLTDRKRQFSVLTDRAQGGTSLHDGAIELMLHRRMFVDDTLGVGEALNENAYGTGLVVRGTHWLTAGSTVDQNVIDRKMIQERVLAAWIFLSPTTLSLNQWRSTYHMEFTGLKKALPESVQILTLEPWKETSFLLRLEHILEINDSHTNEPVTVNLHDIFEPFSIKSVRETTLGANQWLGETTRLVWQKKNRSKTPDRTATQDLPRVILPSMAIKTFIIEVSFPN